MGRGGMSPGTFGVPGGIGTTPSLGRMPDPDSLVSLPCPMRDLTSAAMKWEKSASLDSR